MRELRPHHRSRGHAALRADPPEAVAPHRRERSPRPPAASLPLVLRPHRAVGPAADHWRAGAAPLRRKGPVARRRSPSHQGVRMTSNQPSTKEHAMSAQPTPLTRELHITVETITPAQAAIYLEHVRNPRKLRPAKATVFAADMAAGKWHLGSSSLKFDPAGELRDGQHRLAACVESNMPFPTVIYWNVTDEAIDNTDRGMARQWADVLAGRGIVNTRQVQGIVYLSWRWDNGLLLSVSWHQRVSPTVSEAEEWLEAHPAVLNLTTLSHRISQSVGGKVSVIGSFLQRAG